MSRSNNETWRNGLWLILWSRDPTWYRIWIRRHFFGVRRIYIGWGCNVGPFGATRNWNAGCWMLDAGVVIFEPRLSTLANTAVNLCSVMQEVPGLSSSSSSYHIVLLLVLEDSALTMTRLPGTWYLVPGTWYGYINGFIQHGQTVQVNVLAVNNNDFTRYKRWYVRWRSIVTEKYK